MEYTISITKDSGSSPIGPVRKAGAIERSLAHMRRGGAFRIVGLVLGIVGTVISVTALVFSIVGMLLGKKPVKPNIR